MRPWLIHRRTQWFLDGGSAAVALIFAYILRFDFLVPATLRGVMLSWSAGLFFAIPFLFVVSGGYRATWQFFNLSDFGGLVVRGLPVLAMLGIVRAIVPTSYAVPYSVAIVWYGCALTLWSTVRLVRRLDHETILRLTKGAKRSAIIGTEDTLSGAIRQLQTFGGAFLVGVITNDLQGMQVGGVSVLGPIADLRSIIFRHDIHLLFLSSAELPCIPEVAQICADLNITLRFLPSPHDVMNGKVRVSKNVSVATLRARAEDHSASQHPAVIECLVGRTILITGAGGSIGSELARQVASIPVKRLLLLDQDENSIFELLNEIGRRDTFVPIIADIRDRDSIRHLFDRERPDVVLHAAAYKHVPMMEHNPCEAILNNVCGTRELAEAAVDFSSERFVMISTDKAVRPSSVMGASKRVAEVLIQDQASTMMSRPKRSERTNFACVRFGNVLGSRGSVLPIFLRQIAAGGPITVTHEEMTRYFMTIPQAVRLVLQAATLASAGDVYMLDMGDPVKIMDFAREVIEASGLVPGQDVKIEITGTRPGEKLHEQLWSEDAHVSPTDFPHVFRVRATSGDRDFPILLNKLEEAARDRRADDVRGLLHEMSIEYRTESTEKVAAVLRPV